MKERIYLTGAGVVTPLGICRNELFNALVRREKGIKRITAFDPSNCFCQIAGEIDNSLINVRNAVPKSHRKAIKLMCRDIKFAVVAAKEALADAEIETISTSPTPTLNPNKVGCHIGAGFISADITELTTAQNISKTKLNTLDLQDWGRNGMKHLTPLWLLKYLPNMLACHVTIIHDCRGPSNTLTCSEASSGLSIAESVRCIQRGAANACISGGAESKINLMAFFRRDRNGGLIKATCDSNEINPYGSGNGTVLGEGGGLLIIESENVTKKRNKQPLAEIAGVGSSQSIHSNPLLCDSKSIQYAIEAALKMANISKNEIDAILPLGSGVSDIDTNEIHGLKTVFGNKMKSIPIFSFIPNIGNCGAGHGGIAHAIALSILEKQLIPPLITNAKDSDLFIPKEPLEHKISNILIVTPSLGGQVTTTILRKAI